MTDFTSTFELTGNGYIKAPDTRPVEGSMRLRFETTGGIRVVVSQDRPFGWEHSNYEGTRGEALIQLDRKGLEDLAQTILKFFEVT